MIDKKIQLTFNSSVNKRVKVRSNCELYSHDKNNNEFELTINNHTLTNEEIIILFKFVKSIKYWETQGKIEDNKIKFKFDTTLITDNERVNCYIILKNEEKESDVYSFSFDVKMSEYDLKDNLPVKERYFANSVVVDKLDVLTKEVLATELEKAKNTFALKTDLSEFVRTSDISDVVRTATLNDYQLKSEMPNVVEIVNNTVDSKGFLTTHQSLVDYAKKSELPIDYVSNSKLEELKTQLTIDTSNFATKQELQEVSNRQVMIDTSNLATKQELEQVRNNQPTVDTSNLATKEELQALRGSQPNVDNLVTKDELNSKGYLTQHQSLEDYAKKTELPQPYNDTDIKSRLTVLENRPTGSGNVDTSDFVTKQELRAESLKIASLEFNAKSNITKFEAPFKTTDITSVEDYLNSTNEHFHPQNYGRLYTDKLGNHLVVTGNRKTAKFETLLYTVGNSLPDAYESDFEFSEGDNIKFITSRNIHDYLPQNTGNTGNTTELDNRLKRLEAKNWEIHGRGMPNGVVTAPVGTTYVDEAVTNGALKWIKKTGTGNTGWEVLIGDTGWKILPSVSKLGNSFVKIRRVNNVVSYQFGGLSWGWFGIVRRGGAGYVLQGSDKERNCYIIQNNGIPAGYRTEASLIGNIYNDKGIPYGTWYLGGVGDYNQLRFQFTDPVPTDRDIGDIRISSISYLTNETWPQN
jgi:hypothetical protein|nr:MAG TPA: GENERAL CONTROL PROTEIN GCN4, NOR1 BINDING PROTEIN, ALPHA/BETA COILED.6A [Caudoviricetes sp.]